MDRSVLRSVGSALSADLRELDQAVNRLLASGRGTGSIAGWATADAFSAASYDSAEGATRHAVASVAAQLNAVTGSVSAAGKG